MDHGKRRGSRKRSTKDDWRSPTFDESHGRWRGFRFTHLDVGTGRGS